MSRPDATVLITGAGTATCQSVIKGLRADDAISTRILTADAKSQVAGRYLADGFHQIPLAGDPAFLPALLSVCQTEGVDLLIPIVDYEFECLAVHRSDFEALGCRVAISDLRVIRTCTDKWETYRFFELHGIPTPQTFLPCDLPADLPFPVVVKPRRLGRASIDVYVAADHDELDVFLKRVTDPIVQRAAEGKEYTIDVLCDFDARGINAVVRERVETKSGVSYRGRTVRDMELVDGAVGIAESLGVVGPSNIQCFRTAAGPTFFEINPRYSGALVLSIAAGFNSPACLLRLALGQGLPKRLGEFEPDIVMLRYWQEVFLDGTGAVMAVPWSADILRGEHAD